MKEFSNDPTRNIAELSAIFEGKIAQLQQKIQKLKFQVDHCSGVLFYNFKLLLLLHLLLTQNNQTLQHLRLVQQFLSKSLANQTNSFKTSLKQHQRQLEERNKRMEKYGGGGGGGGKSSFSSSSSNPSASGDSFDLIRQATSQFAMFQPNQPPALTHRRQAAKPTHSNNPTEGRGDGRSMILRKDDHRLRQAEKAEASIKQVELYIIFSLLLLLFPLRLYLYLSDGAALLSDGNSHCRAIRSHPANRRRCGIRPD